MRRVAALLVLGLVAPWVVAFAPSSQSRAKTVLQAGLGEAFKNFFEELDAFVDDATAR